MIALEDCRSATSSRASYLVIVSTTPGAARDVREVGCAFGGSGSDRDEPTAIGQYCPGAVARGLAGSIHDHVVQQGAGSIREYAPLLVNAELWSFWWD